MAKRLNLFFDADDTILDFDAAETAAVTRIFEEYGLINNKGIVEVYKEKNGDCWREFEQGKLERSQIGYQRFKRTFDTFNIQTDLDIDALNKKYWGYLGDQYQVIDGSKELLDYLCDKHNLYIITNGTTSVQNNRFKLSGYDKYFIKRYISEQIGSKKPEKEFFSFIENDLKGIDREISYVIGDSLTSDIKAGENANIKTIWYNRKHLTNNTSIIPDYEVNDYKQLLDLINKLAEV